MSCDTSKPKGGFPPPFCVGQLEGLQFLLYGKRMFEVTLEDVHGRSC
jgi:hypothetical protein